MTLFIFYSIWHMSDLVFSSDRAPTVVNYVTRPRCEEAGHARGTGISSGSGSGSPAHMAESNSLPWLNGVSSIASAICECRSGFLVVLLLRLTYIHALVLDSALCFTFFSAFRNTLELLSVHTFPLQLAPRSLRCFVRVLDELFHSFVHLPSNRSLRLHCRRFSLEIHSQQKSRFDI